MTPPAALVLQLGFADPASALRLPQPPAPALRIALGARLAARGGVVHDAPQGLVCHQLLGSAAGVCEAVWGTIELLAQGTQQLAEELAPVALRAVMMGLGADTEAGRAAAMARASRVLQLSRDHSLLLSRDLYDCLPQALRDQAQLATPPSLVDAEPALSDLFVLDWQAAVLNPLQASTPASAAPQPAAVAASPGEAPAADRWLLLSLGDVERQLLPEHCPFTLGRDKSCGLRLNGDVASRVHGRIVFEAGQFHFVDDSRNGSYLLTPQSEDVFVHRQRLPLLGRGVISAGATLLKQTGDLLHYQVLRSAPPEQPAAAMPAPAIAA